MTNGGEAIFSTEGHSQHTLREVDVAFGGGDLANSKMRKRS